MTNEELIKELQQYPANAEVVYSYINPNGEDVEIEPEPSYNKISEKIYL